MANTTATQTAMIIVCVLGIELALEFKGVAVGEFVASWNTVMTVAMPFWMIVDCTGMSDGIVVAGVVAIGVVTIVGATAVVGTKVEVVGGGVTLDAAVETGSATAFDGGRRGTPNNWDCTTGRRIVSNKIASFIASLFVVTHVL